jgi:hypothetical protein
MTTPLLIDGPDDVDAGWLGDVLRHSGALADGAEVTGFDSREIGTGQVGCNVRYRLEYDPPGAGPETLVAKFASRDETSRAAGVQTLTYETEVAFYRDLATTVDVSRPHCHFAAVEEGTPRVVLVLEDMAPAEQGDQLTGCSPEQARLAVEEAARLHGPRWGDPTLLDHPWLAAKQAPDASVLSMFPAFWAGFVDRYRKDLSDESLEVGERMSATGGPHWFDPDPQAVTVCHGDFRLDNMLFGPPGHPRPLTVVDWQTATLGVGSSDVAYFLSAAMPPQERRECETDLVAVYHGLISGYGITGYSADHCWDDYRRYGFNGFFMAVFASMVVGRTDRGDAMFMVMANGAASQVVDLDGFEFLSSV